MSRRREISKQKGAVLVVALVMLLIVTLLGVAVMQGATLETRMANNSQQRQQAFAAAEATLRQAERFVEDIGFANADLRSGCVGNRCFRASCSNGYCFAGNFLASQEQKYCTTVPASGVVSATPVWSDPALNVWNNANRHITVALPGYDAGIAAGKYIIELRCFVDQVAGPGAGTVDDNTGDVVYRITARGTSRNGRVDAMVQSTYRAVAP